MMSSVAVATSRALGSRVQVAVTDDRALPDAEEMVLAWLANLDRAASRFRADSDISRLNAAGGARTEVSPLCLRAIQVALAVAAQTEGLVDPTVGSAIESIGYDRDFELVAQGEPKLRSPGTTPAVPGWGCVDADAATRTVQLPPGVHLDLGSSAKALAADETAAAASRATGCGVLVNLGGDIAIAGPPPDGGWRVRVTDDHAASPGSPGQTVAALRGGLATSSTTVRAWSVSGVSMHHIVDPRTGMPAPVVWRTVSATAPTCVEANAATTAAIVLGRHAEEWLRKRSIPARLVGREGGVRHLSGWPEVGDDAGPPPPAVPRQHRKGGRQAAVANSTERAL